MSDPLWPLGAHPRVRVTRVVRTQYRIEWEYDGHRFAHDDHGGEYVEARMRRIKYAAVSRAKAYQMAALRLVYARARRYEAPGDRGSCSLCGPEDTCRYHGGPGFKEIIERLARLLARRDAP